MCFPMKYWRQILLPIALIIIFVLFLNGRYFWQQARFYFIKANSATQPPNAIATTSTAPTAAPKEEPNILRIDSLGIRAPIRYTETVSEKVFQKELQDGVVHYPGTANPGKPGNVYIFGHSSDYPWSKGSYKAIFALLSHLEKGQTIVVTDAQGTPFTYTVTGRKVVAPTDLHVLDQQGYRDYLLTLQTSYPIGTALKRLIVTAKLDTASATSSLSTNP